MTGAADPLRVLVFGAGAIGTYVGGSLALAGHRAVFVERAGPAGTIERNGIRIRAADGTEREAPRAAYRIAASAEEALASAEFDVAIVALKSFDVPALVSAAGPTLAGVPALAVLCLSNGVDNEAVLADALGPRRVIAGTVTTAVGRRDAGDVVVERLRGTGVAAGHPLSMRLARAMDEAGLHARLFGRSADMKWSKLLTNLLANATSAILDMTPAEVFADPRLHRLEVDQLREALRVMSALEIRAVDLPGTPVRLLSLAARLPRSLSRPFLARAVGGGRGGKMPSFHIDLHSGRGQSEVAYLNGAVVTHGEPAGVAAPVNRLLTDTLTGLTTGALPLAAYARQPGKLISALAKGAR